MTYFVLLQFELNDGDEAVYETAYQSLEEMGLRRTMLSLGGEIVTLPRGLVSATKRGESLRSLRDTIARIARRRLREADLDGNLFVLVTKDPSWKQTPIDIQN
ncbi:MAG: hypothetical protein MAG453_01410 [Calditrichaeota bacterium]|nr:hypothetical protein [Calditrichota bacterium]